jgi:hypothetical protein
MKTRILHASPRTRLGGFTHGGFLLAMVMTMAGVSLLILASTMRRTGSVAILNDRNSQHAVNVHAAEAAVEKVVARMTYDFANYGLGQLEKNLPQYRTNVPTASASESAYWSQFQFSDGENNVGKTFVEWIGNYSGSLPSQYSGRTCINSPVYRVLSNAKCTTGGATDVVGAVQVDMLAALVPITQWAIFYHTLLEFTSCATMTVTGPVHCNTNVYTGSSCQHTFNGTVTSAGTITSPKNNGSGPGWSYKGTFNGTPPKSQNVPSISLAIGTHMNSVHQIIEMPTPGAGVTNLAERSRLYNQAHVILLISNSTVTARIQAAPSSGEVPGNDPSPTILTSATNVAALATNFPFLTFTNFYDLREYKTVLSADINVGVYAEWIRTNNDVQYKTTTPTILYVANNRSGSSGLPAVRLQNGRNLPVNDGLGFTVATHNPLYVNGHYNCPNSAHLGTSDTSSTVPAALMSDALTILSPTWSDPASTGSYTTRDAANTTVNAAILTGNVPSTGNDVYKFSGGVHNLPRLLEDWMNVSGGQRTLTLNTSILDLFASKVATNQFRNPGNFGLANDPYYDPPKRNFTYDIRFRQPENTPPGIPTAVVLIRKDWALPPPNTTDYYASP